MANLTPISGPSGDFKPKSFWQKPEGITGLLFAAALIIGGGYALYQALPYLITLAENTLYLALLLAGLGAVLYIILDPKMRNLIWFGYKSIMRWITGVFVEIDPIGILKTYVEHLENSLRKMNTQIASLQGQMHKLKTLMQSNQHEIDNAMKYAEAAKRQGDEGQLVLHTRKAGRMQESNQKYQELYQKMEILKRVLTKMYENSGILLEDTKDQVKVKEQERQAIRTSHSAMRSAMSILSGDPDKRAMFDMAMESINNDVANKVGEMERFMEMSGSIMKSIDLQNGVLEEEGMKMLEEWEKKSALMLLGDKKGSDLNLNQAAAPKLDSGRSGAANDYDNLFK